MTRLVRLQDACEEMDRPDCDPVLLERTYAQFPLVNRVVSGWRGTYTRLLAPHLSTGRTQRLLDIGCGGGDVLIDLTRRARRHGCDVHAVGIDPDPRAIDCARRAAARSGIPSTRLEFRRGGSEALVRAGETFDVVVSNHVLHHLDEPGLRGLLEDSLSLATGCVIHSDIRRSRAALLLFGTLTLPLARTSLVRRDGLTSIRRSYTPEELRQRAGTPWQVLSRGPYRNLLVWTADRHG